MRTAYLLYLAGRMERDGGDARCCEDRPPAHLDEPRPVPWRRTRKVVRGVPASLRVFRRSLRLPLARPAFEGQQVITREGAVMGRITDQVVGLESGRASIVIVPEEDRSPMPVVLLLPPEALRRTGHGDVVVLAPDWDTDAVA